MTKQQKSRKLSADERQRAVQLRAAGGSLEDVARALGRSVGAIHAVTSAKTKPKPQRKTKPKPAFTEPEAPAPTFEDLDLGEWLGGVAVQRRADADRLRAEGDDAGAARATRDALQAAALHQRYQPPDQPEGIYVTLAGMRDAADRGRAQVWDYIERCVTALHEHGEHPAPDPTMSPAQNWARAFVALQPLGRLLRLIGQDLEGHKGELRAELSALLEMASVTELAGLAHEWEQWLARPAQVIPRGGKDPSK